MTQTVPDSGAVLDWRVDLLLGPDELLRCLASEIAACSHLNAFLLAVALEQVIDDHLQPASLIDRMGAYVGAHAIPGAGFAGHAAEALGVVVHRVRLRTNVSRALLAVRKQVTFIVRQLAAVVTAPHGEVPDSLAGSLAALLRSADASPLSLALRGKTAVLPSCFQTFDLGLSDVRRLGERLAESTRPTAAPIMVVGVRTSGSYLAPLLAAVLRGCGFDDVATMTMRPRIPLVGGAALLAVDARRRGAHFVVTDDPPVSGSSLARVVEQLAEVGVPRAMVTLAYPRFIDTPDDLRGLDGQARVVLPWDEWDVHRRLVPEVVLGELQLLVGNAARITSVELVEARRPRRAEAHLRAVYRVRFTDAAGSHEVRHVAAQGVGIGYYGEHVEVVARSLPSYSPHIYGVRDGMLYREWFDEAQRVDRGGVSPDQIVAGLAGYAASRRDRLPVQRDRSLKLAGSRPVWETAAVEVSQSFGRAWPIAQVVAVNRLVRKILRVPRPAVIDGTTDLENWFTDHCAPGRLRSVGLQRRAYWHHGLSSYDPVFDLAGAMDDVLDVPFAAALLDRYTSITGEPVSPERWLLLRLAQLWGRRRRDPSAATATRAAAARVLQEYFARVFFADLDAGPAAVGARSAPLCALDVDGVLESEHLGFPSLTSASAFALRALRLHGYRPVLATGRSFAEVRERCLAYGLVGGVAEYGSALYLAEGDEAIDLVPPNTREEIDALRRTLAVMPGVAVDDRYQHTVRARVTGAGVSGPLPAATLASLRLGSSIRTVPGEGQTDFVASSVDKASGLRALLSELGRRDGRESPTIELAVGDTASDAPMLALARQASVPAHAATVLGGPLIWRARAPYQAGLIAAVDRFLGHVPTAGSARRQEWVDRIAGRALTELGCARCRLTTPDPLRAALLASLSVTERGKAGLPGRALRTAYLAK